MRPNAGYQRLRPIKDSPVHSRVFEAIRDAIFAGDLAPGEPLRELHLAKELNVSQASVREGLVHLEISGLVVRIPNKETRVTKLSNEEVRERLDLRESLEGIAWIAAAKRMKSADYLQLSEKMKDISLAVAHNDYPALASADLAFHRHIWEQSRNPTLARILEQLTAPLFAFVSLMHSMHRDDLRKAVNSHESIITALQNGGSRLIRERLHDHLSGSYDRFLNSGAKDLQSLYARKKP
jgi:DNA-binding GntR family transcriptional regulator